MSKQITEVLKYHTEKNYQFPAIYIESHFYLYMKTINEKTKSYYKRFHLRLNTHPNPLIKNLATLTIPRNPPLRLKRK